MLTILKNICIVYNIIFNSANTHCCFLATHCILCVLIYTLMPAVQKIQSQKITWYNITQPGEDEIDFLRQQFNFDPFNLKDSYSHVRSQRPKLDMHDDYLFLVLHFPIFNTAENRIVPAEIDFFISHQYLVTVHNGELTALNEFAKLCEEMNHRREQYMNTNSSALLYEMLDRLFDHCYPIIDHIGGHIEEIEDNVLLGQEKEMVKEILQSKRNIVSFRKIMQTHKNIIKKLITMDHVYFPKVDMTPYYNKLLEETKDIWEILGTQKDTIDALHETNESSLSFKLNDIMKTLTIFSVVVFPLTLVAAIFGMNTRYLPVVGLEHDFWLIMGTMLVMTLLMFLYFKHKKWL